MLASTMLALCAAGAAISEAGTAAGATQGTSYFIDCAYGNDSNSGTSTTQPWLSMNRVNSTIFKPGDVISFQRGTQCVGTLAPRGSGTGSSPIVVTAYGSGAKPKINGNGATAAVFLHNVQGYELNNLDISNSGPTPTASQYRVGIYVLLEDYGIGSHYVVNSVDVHNVNGCDCRFPTPSGGIMFNAAGSNVPTGFDQVVITGNTVAHVDREGIGNVSSWERRAQYPGGLGSTWVPTTNYVISKNVINDAGGDGILVYNGSGAVVVNNVVNGFNARSAEFNTGAWAWNSDNTIFARNDVSHGAGFGMAFDVDGGNVGTVYEYNFSHDNNGGFLLLCNPPGASSNGNTIRYNISQNDMDAGASSVLGVISMPCGNESDTKIYNNDIYAPNATRLVNNRGSFTATLSNNIFVGAAAGSTINDPYGVYTANLYQNVTSPPAGDTYTVVGSPRFVAAGTMTSLTNAGGYQLLAGSPALGTGVVVSANGGCDYYGNPVPTASSNIGAYQGPGV